MSPHSAVYSSDNGREAQPIYARLKALLARDEPRTFIPTIIRASLNNPHSDAPALAPLRRRRRRRPQSPPSGSHLRISTSSSSSSSTFIHRPITAADTPYACSRTASSATSLFHSPCSYALIADIPTRPSHNPQFARTHPQRRQRPPQRLCALTALIVSPAPPFCLPFPFPRPFSTAVCLPFPAPTPTPTPTPTPAYKSAPAAQAAAPARLAHPHPHPRAAPSCSAAPACPLRPSSSPPAPARVFHLRLLLAGVDANDPAAAQPVVG
ncbi:hypothetical protein C8J57DRAFT_1492676 [Mycena rebaudengoi]|nr:hypothetical protein C8J57DRAFT_1492676 [Mycena rebaudengoi]